jgi:hypothetical protein
VLISLFIAGLIVFISPSCENNNELDLYGNQACDTNNITWNSKIASILSDKCVKCHGPELSYNQVRHDNYTSELIVVNDGRLRRVINDSDPSTRMPKNEQTLDSCKLLIINIWIDNGAPEN